jgi:uncharacterized membrane protein
MKSTIILLMALLALTANAQQKTELNKTNVPLKTTAPVLKPIAPPPPASQTNTQSKPASTQPTLTDADYFLAGAVIKISTGDDNKEPNTSTASFYIRPRKSNGIVVYKLEEYANEIKANQAVDLRLDRATTLAAAQNSLQNFKQNGLSVVVAYCNKNFCTDAWKINNITLTLEFKDAAGNPAPNGYASKIISFPVSSGTLGFVAGCNPLWITDAKRFIGYSDQMSKMLLKTDEYFNPLPAKLLNWFVDDAN